MSYFIGPKYGAIYNLSSKEKAEDCNFLMPKKRKYLLKSKILYYKAAKNFIIILLILY
jgi:hypothetical protein